MRYSPVPPPSVLFLPYQQKDRQQPFYRLLPIVFDDKALSSVISFVVVPAYLQLAALLNRECCGLPAATGITGISPLRGTLRAAFPKKDGSIIVPCSCIVASSRHHMICTANPTVIALRRSLTPLREVLASEAVLLRRSGKIRSTELFGFQGTSEDG